MTKAKWLGIAVAMTVLANGAMARANQLVTITVPDRAGEIPSTWLDYPGPPRANVLLPTGYDPAKRYPLLVLLAGLGNNYNSFVGDGIQPLLAGLNAIVVMPEGGSGWYTDWWNNGTRGAPSWESYELNEVLPQVLARYKILPQRRYHAIAGFSMGGLGATYLGGRLPGFFGSVATMSGFVDPQLNTLAAAIAAAEPVTAFAPLHGDDNVDAVEGPPSGFYATGHDPTAVASNLAQTRVFQSTGTGFPSSGTLSDPSTGAVGIILEGTFIHPMNVAYHAALAAAGVNVTYHVQPGGHDLADALPQLKAMVAWGLFKPVVTHPSSWTNQTVATSGQLWDIGYRFTTPPTQVVTFRRSGTRLSISAAGSPVTLTTSRGCVISTQTPAQVTIPAHTCRAQDRDQKSSLLTHGMYVHPTHARARAAAAAPVPPTQDPFYVPSGNWASQPPGMVLRSREITTPVLFAAFASHTYQLLYRTTDASGRPTATVTTLFIPTKPASGPRKLASYQQAEDSLTTGCAPSYAIQTGVNPDNIQTIPTLLGQGWDVVVPDYEGPQSEFAVGPLEGQATLDSLRAAERFPAAGLDGTSTPAGIIGYSGGSIATAWADSRYTSYAPELNLVAVAAGGVPADPIEILPQLDGSVLYGAVILVMDGLDRAWPDLGLSSLLNAKGQAVATKFGADAYGCGNWDVATPFGTTSNYFNYPSGGALVAVPSVKRVFARDDLITAPTFGAATFLYNAVHDEIILVHPVDELNAADCARGSTISYERDPIAPEHEVGSITRFVPAAVAYLRDRFAGSPAPNTCPPPSVTRPHPPQRRRHTRRHRRRHHSDRRHAAGSRGRS